MNAIQIIATKEFQDGIRSRWVLSISLVFAVLAIGLAYFGASASGIIGFTSLATTIISLASLAIFLIPLIALLLAYDSIIGEDEQGTLLLLLTYPINRTQLLLGKFLGHAAIMASATVLGFGGAAILVAIINGQLNSPELWRSFVFFIITATLLGWVFIAMAYVASVVVNEKARAAGIALMLWFWFVLIFDMLILGGLVMNKGESGGEWMGYLLLLNPTDVFRLANLAGFEAARSYAGLTYIGGGSLFEPWALTGILVVWVLAPLTLSIWLFNRRRI